MTGKQLVAQWGKFEMNSDDFLRFTSSDYEDSSVSSVLGQRMKDGRIEYLIHWKDPTRSDEWVPNYDLICPAHIWNYIESHPPIIDKNEKTEPSLTRILDAFTDKGVTQFRVYDSIQNKVLLLSVEDAKTRYPQELLDFLKEIKSHV